MLCLPSTMSDDMCLIIVALEEEMPSSWFDLLLLLRTNHTYIATGTKARAWSTAAVVLPLLYCRFTAVYVMVLY